MLNEMLPRIIIISYTMFTKILFLAALIVISTAYTEENNVLILTEEDFPGIITEFQYILIEFYAPWCGHCKKLTPIYDEVATELKSQGSPVKLAKIDCDAHPNVKSTYGVQGFPTLKFYLKGQEVKYNGQRTKQFMVNWLSKKTRDPVVTVAESELQGLQNDKVNIVFHGDLSSEAGQVFSNQAKLDDFNTYYNVQETSLAQGTLQIYRPFGSKASAQATADLKSFISLNERPTVYAFNDRTIGEIFSDRTPGIILFESSQAKDALIQAFEDAATQVRVTDGKAFIFSNIPVSAEHYGGLAQYIKIDVHKSAIVHIDGGKRVKHVLTQVPSEVSSQDIVSFVASIENGSAKEYQLDEQVTYEEIKVEEEQL